jgi:hypothetical protein
MSLIPTHWYYNTESGQLTQGNNVENFANNLFGGLGWHELNIAGNATGQQAAAEAKKEFPNGKTPSYAPVTPASIASSATSSAASTLSGILGPIAGALAPLADFFGRLTQAHTWQRIGEGLLGVILIAVGLAHMTKAVPIATAIASKVP